MVQEPSFLTSAAQDVFRLRSRSGAVMVSLPAAASNKKFDRIGMVVFLSTTPCVAVSSLRRSDLLTVISIAVPCWVAIEVSAMVVAISGPLLLLLTTI